jgi:hypothetical protein
MTWHIRIGSLAKQLRVTATTPHLASKLINGFTGVGAPTSELVRTVKSLQRVLRKGEFHERVQLMSSLHFSEVRAN